MKNFFLFFCCAALTACSSVSVVDERENAALAPQSAPAALFVRPFQIAKGAQFDVASPAGKEDPRISVARTMTEGVLSRGPRWIAPAKVLGEKDKTPAKGLLIEGSILRAAQGSRALRIGIGFGAGRTHLDTAVRVFNLDASSKKPWFTCKTTGGSNTEPGLITSLVVPSAALLPLLAGIAGGAVSSVAKGGKGVSQDAKRTGRVIAAVIHDRLAVRGLVPRKAWPKRRGSVGTPAAERNVPSLD